jgi:hypothetical protein
MCYVTILRYLFKFYYATFMDPLSKSKNGKHPKSPSRDPNQIGQHVLPTHGRPLKGLFCIMPF